MADGARIALVTGASRGIGRAAAIALGAEGYHVICLARTVGGLEEVDDAITAAGGSATLVPLDLKDYAALDRLGASIFERWGRLDALLGNAGAFGGLSPLGHIEPKAFEEMMAVNVTANWRLIRSLDPLLRQSPAGRVLFLSSTVARQARVFWGGYAVSKAALETLALTYAGECEGTAIRVNLLNPGGTATGMRRKAFPGEDPASIPQPEDVARLIVEMLSPDYADTGTRVNYREWAAAKA